MGQSSPGTPGMLSLRLVMSSHSTPATSNPKTVNNILRQYDNIVTMSPSNETSFTDAIVDVGVETDGEKLSEYAKRCWLNISQDLDCALLFPADI